MENQRTKYVLLSCAVILVIACLCGGLIFAGGLGVSLIWPFSSDKGESESSTIDVTETPVDAVIEELPDELIGVVTEIESQVMQIRGLQTSQSVDRTLISPEELEEIVINDFFSEYTDQDAREDVLVLSSLGLLPEDFELKDFYSKLYSEQIAGFYDDETKEIYIVQGADFGGSEKITYAHEFTHVLQDKVYDLSDGLGLNDEACEIDSEKCAAVQSLIEGDATQTELLWFQAHASRKDYLDLMETYDTFTSPVLDSAPPYMSADLLFPYEKGFTFVEYLYDRGGFSEVDKAYKNLPLSTEQILHPERYPDDVPVLVTLPDFSSVLDQGWSLFDQNVMGEWYTFLILNKAHQESFRLPEDTALDAAAGWGGDAYAFYLNERTNEVIFIMDTVWDTVDDAGEFADAFEKYANLRWQAADDSILDLATWDGENITVVLMRDGNRTLWVMGPTGEIVETILVEIDG